MGRRRGAHARERGGRRGGRELCGVQQAGASGVTGPRVVGRIADLREPVSCIGGIGCQNVGGDMDGTMEDCRDNPPGPTRASNTILLFVNQAARNARHQSERAPSRNRSLGVILRCFGVRPVDVAAWHGYNAVVCADSLQACTGVLESPRLSVLWTEEAVVINQARTPSTVVWLYDAFC